jgi:hypothetical protein
MAIGMVERRAGQTSAWHHTRLRIIFNRTIVSCLKTRRREAFANRRAQDKIADFPSSTVLSAQRDKKQKIFLTTLDRSTYEV